MVHVRRLHEKFGSQAQFLFVYITETPHELPMQLLPFAEPPGAPPGSRLRLLPRVRAGMDQLSLRFPCLIDNEKREVETLYNAYPTRMVIVDAAGRIALNSQFFPWERIYHWFERYCDPLSP